MRDYSFDIHLQKLAFNENVDAFDYDVTVVNKDTNRLASRFVSGGLGIAEEAAYKLLEKLR